MFAEKKSFSFILPAVLTASLVFGMLPRTEAVLRDIPARLELIAEAEAKEPPISKAPETEEQPAEDLPAGVGNYEDGVYTGSSRGYGGNITVQVTVQGGQITDIQILSAPGETDPYYSLACSVIESVKRQQTWEVDTISGATYSSRGILGAVQNAITGETVVNEEPPSVDPVGTTSQDQFEEPAAYKDGTYYGEADGFGGSIRVEVIIKDGKIQSIRIVSAGGESGSYLASARRVIDRILTKGSPNVDAVSGATYSSTGIINAVKRALSKAAVEDGNGIEVCDTGLSKDSAHGANNEKAVPMSTDIYPPDALADGVYRGTGEGFGGDIVIEMTVSGGRITGITVISAEDESPEYFNRAKGLIASIIATQRPDVDAVSGATMSSGGILAAVKEAYQKAVNKAKAEAGDGSGAGGDSSDDQGSGSDVEPQEGGGSGSDSGSGDDSGSGSGSGDDSGSGSDSGDGEDKFQDGTYRGSAWCDDGYEFYYQINVAITVTDGRIATVSVSKGEDQSDSPEDNDYYLNMAKKGRTRSGKIYPGIPAQIIEKQSADVDTVSGATYSSKTIISAAKSIIAGIPVIKAENESQSQEGIDQAAARGLEKDKASEEPVQADGQQDVVKPREDPSKAADASAEAEEDAANASAEAGEDAADASAEAEEDAADTSAEAEEDAADTSAEAGEDAADAAAEKAGGDPSGDRQDAVKPQEALKPQEEPSEAEASADAEDAGKNDEAKASAKDASAEKDDGQLKAVKPQGE